MEEFRFASHRRIPTICRFVVCTYTLRHTLPKSLTSSSDHTLWVPNPAILKVMMGKRSKAEEAEGGGWPCAA